MLHKLVCLFNALAALMAGLSLFNIRLWEVLAQSAPWAIMPLHIIFLVTSLAGFAHLFLCAKSCSTGSCHQG